MIDNEEFKIIQLLPMPNDYTYQGVVFGLVNDGKVYSWRRDDRGFGWVLEMDNVFYGMQRGI